MVQLSDRRRADKTEDPVGHCDDCDRLPDEGQSLGWRTVGTRTALAIWAIALFHGRNCHETTLNGFNFKLKSMQ